MPTRFDVERAVLASDLPMPCVCVMLVLAAWTDYKTAAIPPGNRKSLKEISAAAGASHSTIAKVLDQLEQDGWIRRKRPTEDERKAGGKTGYRLLIPAEGVVRHTDYPPEGSPSHGLPPTSQNEGGSPSHGLGVVREVELKTVTKRINKKTYDESFVEFWKTYPRNVGKLTAEKAFIRAVKKASAEEIILGAKRLRDDPNLPEKKFIPHPTTWLNRGGWLDDPLPPLIGAARPATQQPDEDGWVQPVSPFRGLP